MTRSTADRFIAVMADLRALEPAEDDPMRYTIWRTKEIAEAVIGTAIGEAAALVQVAEMMQRDHRDAVKELRAATNPETKPS